MLSKFGTNFLKGGVMWDMPRVHGLEQAYNVQCRNWAQMNEHWNR